MLDTKILEDMKLIIEDTDTIPTSFKCLGQLGKNGNMLMLLYSPCKRLPLCNNSSIVTIDLSKRIIVNRIPLFTVEHYEDNGDGSILIMQIAYISGNGGIYLKRALTDSNIESHFFMDTRLFDLQPNGIITERFLQENGTYNLNDAPYLYRKGELSNHLPRGKWVTITYKTIHPKTNYNYDRRVYVEQVYHKGIPRGIWKYYNTTYSIKDNHYKFHKGKYLLMEEVYNHLGQVVDRRYFNENIMDAIELF